MKNILLTLGVIFLGFGFSTAQTQSEVKRNFTLHEAQAYAMENAYSVKGTDYDLKVARKKVWETIAEGLPQIDATADYNNNLRVATSLFPDILGGDPNKYIPIRMGQRYSSSATVTATQKIFDGAYIVGTMAAKVFVQLSKDQKEKSEIEIKDAVAQAYFNVLVAEDNLKTIEENLHVNEKLLKETSAYYENGFREELDVDQIRLNLNTTKNQLSDAKRAIRTSLIVLKYSMGMDIEQEIKLESGLDQLVDPIRAEDPNMSGYDVNNHIDFKIIQTQLEAQSLVIKKEKASYLPTISAFINYGKNTSTDYTNVFKSSVPWFESSMLGFKMSLPIFSAGMRRSKVKQEKLNYMKIETQQQEMEQNLKKDLTISYSNLVNAREKYENDVEGRTIAKRIYDRTRIKFNEGISTSTELSENEKQYLDAHTAYINSTLQLLNSKVAFDKALGKL
jgi:outer membrane protein TolC